MNVNMCIYACWPGCNSRQSSPSSSPGLPEKGSRLSSGFTVNRTKKQVKAS
ncbi:3-phosphoinositide-dependent protein kinase 1 isoform X1, partial [Clarias magur]